MANRSAAASVTSAALPLLLVVAQMTSALFVTPEVVLMRVKRHPDPMRSFSFSGFDPNGQMAAFTGMAGGYPMFGGNGYGPPPRAGPYHYGPPPQGQDSYGQSTQDSYGPPPTGVEQQPGAAGAAADPNSPKLQYGGPSKPSGAGAPADSNEQQNNSVEQVDTKKPHKGRDGPSSNAEASFNAWFPIMFGVFPNGAGGNNGGGGQLAGGNSAGRGNEYPQGQGQQQNQQQGPSANSYGQNNGGYGQNNGGYERSSGSTTVIANSVSNGRHGVATSHAIAYGNPRASSRK